MFPTIALFFIFDIMSVMRIPLLSSCGNEDVTGLDNIFKGKDGISLHAGLKGADGVDLSNVDDASVGAHGGGATLTDITVSANDSLLPGHHDVSGTHETIREGVLASVQVVELGLGDGVINIDSWEEEGSSFLHGVQTVNTGGGLLGNTLTTLGDLVPLVSLAGLKDTLEDGKDDLEFGIVGGLWVWECSVLKEDVLGLLSLVDDESHVSAIIDNEVRSVALAIIFWPGEGVDGAFPVLLKGLSLPRKDGGRLITGDGGGGVVLSGEDVARAPSDVTSEGLEGLDQDGSLDGHVEGSRDTGIAERSGRAELFTARHETRHLNLGQFDILATIVRKRDISNCENESLGLALGDM
jgi:hypothetical protein